MEPEQWEDNGGGPCTIRYYEGVLIVRAPDFVHRGLVGYPFEPRRTETETETAGRYVDFTGNIAMIQNVGFTPVPVTGAVGGTSGGNP
ncbi:MAG: hypothetical protein EXS00_04885 [Phycisphaerales bacterium]|nr:hypothetical protein [Phycisphaerales bacterium]